MIAYFDSSAIVKLVIEEHGSELARELWLGFEPCTSTVSRAESRAAIAAARRAGRLSEIDFKRAAKSLAEYLDEAEFVDVDLRLADEAGELAERHGLRGFDAVHLATAVDVLDDDSANLVVAWDDALAIAASSEGINVARELEPAR